MPILVVDDSMLVRFVTIKLLKDLGYSDILEAGTVPEAKSAFMKRVPALVICDFHLPDMLTGCDFLRWVRGLPDPAAQNTPFFIVTTERSRDIVEAGISLRLTSYLLKPLNKEILHERLKKIGL